MSVVKVTLKRKFIPNTLAFELPAGNTKQAIINVISKCKEKHNDYVQVTIDTPKKPRTLLQNSKFHAMVQEIANETGDDFDYLKMEIKRQSIKRGYPFVTSKVTGEAMPTSSAEVSAEQLNMLIDQCYEIGAFLGMTFRFE